MGKVRHPIYSNSSEVKCGTQPETGINITRCCVNSYIITSAPVKSVTHWSFWWCVYAATSRVQIKGGTYAKGNESFSFGGYEVPSEPSEPTGKPKCFLLKPRLLLMYFLQRWSFRVEFLGTVDYSLPLEYMLHWHSQRRLRIGCSWPSVWTTLD